MSLDGSIILLLVLLMFLSFINTIINLHAAYNHHCGREDEDRDESYYNRLQNATVVIGSACTILAGMILYFLKKNQQQRKNYDVYHDNSTYTPSNALESSSSEPLIPTKNKTLPPPLSLSSTTAHLRHNRGGDHYSDTVMRS